MGGTHTANVDFWVMTLAYISENVSSDYWLHTIISSLLTLSLGDAVFVSAIWEGVVQLWSELGSYGRFLSQLCAGITLASVCLFALHQAYDTVTKARRMGILQKNRRLSRKVTLASGKMRSMTEFSFAGE